MYSASLEEVYSIAASVARNLATIGVSLQRCHVPGRMTTTEDEIGVSEQEYGMGEYPVMLWRSHN